MPSVGRRQRRGPTSGADLGDVAGPCSCVSSSRRRLDPCHRKPAQAAVEPNEHRTPHGQKAQSVARTPDPRRPGHSRARRPLDPQPTKKQKSSRGAGRPALETPVLPPPRRASFSDETPMGCSGGSPPPGL